MNVTWSEAGAVWYVLQHTEPKLLNHAQSAVGRMSMCIVAKQKHARRQNASPHSFDCRTQTSYDIAVLFNVHRLNLSHKLNEKWAFCIENKKKKST